jgi:eukaryotic-like serine/threonine-protein kinase
VLGASLESENSRGYYPGHVLGNRYELVSLLGEGGTGVVWIAHDRVLNLEVAVKLMLGREAAREDSARRAQLEARSAARLTHPAVCRAMDFGLSTYGEPFIVSELLAGESLEDAIAREGRMEATHAVRVLLPILDALRAAHESGIVHRDVKPANIFLARDGMERVQPKLLDFGIAHWLGDTRATSDGGVCGTPEYMSPEQASGSDDIDARSDLWNFCATLYEVLTGVVPFRGDNYNAVLLAVQTADPEPITAFCAGDDALAAIILRGLERSREGRWQSAAELADELQRWLLARGVETDICDRSLRARLVDRAAGEGGHAAPYAHVLSGSSRRGSPLWKRLSIALAAGTALVALASSFQALRADDQPALRADDQPVDPLVAKAAAPHPAITAPPPRADQVNEPARAPSSVAIQAEATALAKVPAPPARHATKPPVPAEPAAAPSPTVAGPEPRVPRAAEPLARRRSKNALNYDFGL